MPSQVLSVADGCLHWELFNDGPGARSAAVVVGGFQLGGVYEMCFHAFNAVPGWKIANLLWPQSDVWPRDGEIDYPEGGLDRTFVGFMHNQGGLSPNDQQQAGVGSPKFDVWHYTKLVWVPGVKCEMYLDGVLMQRLTDRVPSTPMRWILQVESDLGNPQPKTGAKMQFAVDWLRLSRPA
jgi:beta-glucanase (GH16 family)